MEKQHYIYRMFNEQSGEYYIGQRTCTGTAWLDGKYKGSGVLITKKVKAHPEQWKKEILCFAASHEMLNELEILYIGDAWRDDPLCLNLCAGGNHISSDFWTEEERAAMSSRMREVKGTEEARAAQAARAKKRWESEEERAAESARTKKYWESEENRAAQSAAQKKRWESEEARAAVSARSLEQWQVRLTSPEGDRVEISRNLVLDYLLRDYTFTQLYVYVQHHELKQCCKYNGKKAVALLLADCGWVYGQNTAYTTVGAKQVEETLK